MTFNKAKKQKKNRNEENIRKKKLIKFTFKRSFSSSNFI